MELIKCPKCGVPYSPTYDSCPFCAEDEDAIDDKPHRRKRRLLTRRNAQSARGALIAALVLVLALLSVYLFSGELVQFGMKSREPAETAGETGSEPGGEQPGGEGEDAVSAPPETVQPGGEDVPPEETADVSNAALNRSDFTLSYAGEKFTIKLSGTEARPTWSIDNANVASIAADGTVTAIANGNTEVHCKVGSRDLACTVRVRNTGRDAAPASAPTVAEPVAPAAPAAPGSASVPKAPEDPAAETKPAETKPAASGSAQHVDASALSVKTNYGTKLQKDPGSGYPDCTVRIGGDPISLVISGTDVPVSSWTSDKTSVVEVSDAGKLTPVSPGTAHVTATVGDAEITCIIRVR